jgi:hypothetical protein
LWALYYREKWRCTPVENEIIELERKKSARPSGRFFFGLVGGEITVSYPVDIRRCQHIKTNGTQCGSPALRGWTFCYHHHESRPERVTVKGRDGKASKVLVTLFEDAHSIQTMVRQVVILMLEDKIDDKKAGRVLYALQIASANLRHMEAEKPRPVQVVVDPAKVAETPLGMTPWSGNEKGHELEDEAVGFQGEMAAKLKREANAVRERYGKHRLEAWRMAREMKRYLASEPKPNYEELWRNMELMSRKIEENLAQ